jgi:cyclin-dependent kinase-like
VFEYVERTLLQVLEASPGGLPPEAVRRYVWQLVRAVRWCHQHNVIHRDVKPENLLVKGGGGSSGSSGGPGGGVGQLLLCDFGFARLVPDAADASITDYVSTRWYRWARGGGWGGFSVCCSCASGERCSRLCPSADASCAPT